jgi:ParB family chromosome partitioning protein
MIMAGTFNINQLLGSMTAQTGGTEGPAADMPAAPPALKVIAININDLIPSGDNFYSVDNIAELKTSIEMFGVVQPLAVKPLDGGKYRIIAGHRRYTACMELVAEGKRDFAYIPCGLQGERDEIKERILLIMTNSTTRELSDWEKMKQAEELTKYFTVLKKRDNMPGRVRDLVAEALNTSATQLARLNAISKNIIPELAEEFQAGRLGVSAAYELSGMTEEQQQDAAAELQQKGALSLNDVKERKQDTPEPSTVERPTLREYPETPADFSEGEDWDNEDEQDAPIKKDFTDMSADEKAKAAIVLLDFNRYSMFNPGEDTRVLDYVIDTLDTYITERDALIIEAAREKCRADAFMNALKRCGCMCQLCEREKECADSGEKCKRGADLLNREYEHFIYYEARFLNEE